MTILYIILGLVAGGLSGVIGIGGGVVIVPALIFIFGMSQQSAQGTTLTLMVPPIGILAAYQYYKQGFVDIRVSMLIMLGFIIGSFISSKFALSLPTKTLSRIFAITVIIIGIKMLLSK